MSHHLVTVCMFCLLCAAHNICGSNIKRFVEENDPYAVVNFNQETTQKYLPFDIEHEFKDFGAADLGPFAEDQHRHGTKKKNLSEDKKMRYMQKLSKLRSHRHGDKTFDRLSEKVPHDKLVNTIPVNDDRSVSDRVRDEDKHISDGGHRKTNADGTDLDAANGRVRDNDLSFNSANEFSERIPLTANWEHESLKKLPESDIVAIQKEIGFHHRPARDIDTPAEIQHHIAEAKKHATRFLSNLDRVVRAVDGSPADIKRDMAERRSGRDLTSQDRLVSGWPADINRGMTERRTGRDLSSQDSVVSVVDGSPADIKRDMAERRTGRDLSSQDRVVSVVDGSPADIKRDAAERRTGRDLSSQDRVVSVVDGSPADIKRDMAERRTGRDLSSQDRVVSVVDGSPVDIKRDMAERRTGRDLSSQDRVVSVVDGSPADIKRDMAERRTGRDLSSQDRVVSVVDGSPADIKRDMAERRTGRDLSSQDRVVSVVDGSPADIKRDMAERRTGRDLSSQNSFVSVVDGSPADIKRDMAEKRTGRDLSSQDGFVSVVDGSPADIKRDMAERRTGRDLSSLDRVVSVVDGSPVDIKRDMAERRTGRDLSSQGRVVSVVDGSPADIKRDMAERRTGRDLSSQDRVVSVVDGSPADIKRDMAERRTGRDLSSQDRVVSVVDGSPADIKRDMAERRTGRDLSSQDRVVSVVDGSPADIKRDMAERRTGRDLSSQERVVSVVDGSPADIKRDMAERRTGRDLSSQDKVVSVVDGSPADVKRDMAERRTGRDLSSQDRIVSVVDGSPADIKRDMAERRTGRDLSFQDKVVSVVDGSPADIKRDMAERRTGRDLSSQDRVVSVVDGSPADIKRDMAERRTGRDLSSQDRIVSVVDGSPADIKRDMAERRTGRDLSSQDRVVSVVDGSPADIKRDMAERRTGRDLSSQDKVVSVVDGSPADIKRDMAERRTGRDLSSQDIVVSVVDGSPADIKRDMAEANRRGRRDLSNQDRVVTDVHTPAEIEHSADNREVIKHHPEHFDEPIKSDAEHIAARLENIQVSPNAYIEEIFRQFGDIGTMTMNVSGFNKMLQGLQLEKMLVGGQVNTEKPSYFHKTAQDEAKNHTCVSSADLLSTVNTGLSHKHDLGKSHVFEQILTKESLKAICPILLYQHLANTSAEREGCLINNKFAQNQKFDPKVKRSDQDMSSALEPSEFVPRSQNMLEVWLYSSLSIFAISACGLLGVAVIPIMHKTYYDHIMQFLVALAVGTLCGDALLHLMPHAMSPLDHDHGSGHDHEHGLATTSSHNDGMWKGLVAMAGVVFFYFTEKGLTVVAEWRKRRQKLDKENKLPSRVRVMRDETAGGCSGGAKAPITNSTSNSFLKIFNSNRKSEKDDPTTKMCKHKYSEYPYCYDEIATDTHDHHHHRDGQIPPSPKSKKNNSVSAISSNVMNPETKESEPTAKDWLLNYMDEDKQNKAGDNSGKESGVEMNNIKHKDGEDGKDLKEEESYTVILREHSRAHHGHSHAHGHVHAPPSSLSSVAWMVIMGDGLHNFTDGMAIGAAFASNIAGGFSTAIAVLCHELPHELGDFAVLLKAGMSVRRAICYNALSSALCLAGMVCGVLVGHAPTATRWVFAAAAGMFIYIALVDMMPELSSSHSKEGTFCQCLLQLLGLSAGVGIMLLIALYEEDLKRLFG